MDTVVTQEPVRLLHRLQTLAQSPSQPGDAFVPIDGFPIYYLLASEIARMAAEEGGANLCVLVDAQTALQVDAVDGARTAAGKVMVFGQPPASWAGASNLASASLSHIIGDRDLFIVVLSPRLSLALACDKTPTGLRGAWTADRANVLGLARVLAEVAAMPEFSPDCLAISAVPTPDECSMPCALRLMSLLARQLALRQRDIAMDKDDLSSVLNILKVVSSKRRAHDILFVFVEQIAKAIHVDRCSVVRVWGGDPVGHVLASHEDESVHDLVIDLQKYPEIRRSMETRAKVVINDTRRDPIMRSCSGSVGSSGIASLIIIPVILFDQNIGSLLLRAARVQGGFTLRETSFCEIVAEAAANALERGHLFESIQKANERLEYLADTDGLTGLYNHRYFRQRLEDEFERARRYSLPLSCMIMDIDNFKRINDNYGHLQGDTVLRGIAATALASVRKSDIVARYGGEEFVVIMTQTGIEGAKAQADRILRDIRASVYDGMSDADPITVSIGVAVFDAETMPDCEALIRVADNALYAAKRNGKNRIEVGVAGATEGEER